MRKYSDQQGYRIPHKPSQALGSYNLYQNQPSTSNANFIPNGDLNNKANSNEHAQGVPFNNLIRRERTSSVRTPTIRHSIASSHHLNAIPNLPLSVGLVSNLPMIDLYRHFKQDQSIPQFRVATSLSSSCYGAILPEKPSNSNPNGDLNNINNRQSLQIPSSSKPQSIYTGNNRQGRTSRIPISSSAPTSRKPSRINGYIRDTTDFAKDFKEFSARMAMNNPRTHSPSNLSTSKPISPKLLKASRNPSPTSTRTENPSIKNGDKINEEKSDHYLEVPLFNDFNNVIEEKPNEIVEEPRPRNYNFEEIRRPSVRPNGKSNGNGLSFPEIRPEHELRARFDLSDRYGLSAYHNVHKKRVRFRSRSENQRGGSFILDIYDPLRNDRNLYEEMERSRRLKNDIVGVDTVQDALDSFKTLKSLALGRDRTIKLGDLPGVPDIHFKFTLRQKQRYVLQRPRKKPLQEYYNDDDAELEGKDKLCFWTKNIFQNFFGKKILFMVF